MASMAFRGGLGAFRRLTACLKSFLELKFNLELKS